MTRDARPYRSRWGKNVAEARTDAGITQAELAALTGISQQAISNFETGYRAPTDPHKAILADALGEDPEVLFDIEDVYADLDALRGER